MILMAASKTLALDEPDDLPAHVTSTHTELCAENDFCAFASGGEGRRLQEKSLVLLFCLSCSTKCTLALLLSDCVSELVCCNTHIHSLRLAWQSVTWSRTQTDELARWVLEPCACQHTGTEVTLTHQPSETRRNI